MYWASASLTSSIRSSCSKTRQGVDHPDATPLTGTEKCLAPASMAVPSGYFVGASEPQMRRM